MGHCRPWVCAGSSCERTGPFRTDAQRARWAASARLIQVITKASGRTLIQFLSGDNDTLIPLAFSLPCYKRTSLGNRCLQAGFNRAHPHQTRLHWALFPLIHFRVQLQIGFLRLKSSLFDPLTKAPTPSPSAHLTQRFPAPRTSLPPFPGPSQLKIRGAFLLLQLFGVSWVVFPLPAQETLLGEGGSSSPRRSGRGRSPQPHPSCCCVPGAAEGISPPWHGSSCSFSFSLFFFPLISLPFPLPFFFFLFFFHFSFFPSLPPPSLETSCSK